MSRLKISEFSLLEIKYTNFNDESRARMDFDRKKLKFMIFSKLGARCKSCGYDKDEKALQIDHVNNDGAEHRRQLNCKAGSYKLYKSVLESIKNNEKKFQILCANCNWIKRYDTKNQSPQRNA